MDFKHINWFTLINRSTTVGLINEELLKSVTFISFLASSLPILFSSFLYQTKQRSTRKPGHHTRSRRTFFTRESNIQHAADMSECNRLKLFSISLPDAIKRFGCPELFLFFLSRTDGQEKVVALINYHENWETFWSK